MSGRCCRSLKSAFPGHIEEIPFIHVDNFEDGTKSAYFLSHYHGDHVCGLGGQEFYTRLKRNNAFVYASAVTVAIIRENCPLLSPYLKVLDLGRNTVIIKDEDKEIYLNVTTLPAGHSLGSTMFLFENKNKKILYTGDFRISKNSVAKYKHFHTNGDPINLDVLYVDTTFQKVPSFPRRCDVIRNVVLHIQNWLSLSDSHQVLMLTSANYGYEYICNEIYDQTKLKTFVGLNMNIYRHFPNELQGVTSDSSSRLCLRSKYGYRGEPNPLVLTIYFSALKWGDEINLEEDYLTYKDNRIDVCFSTHCGRDELLFFINYFKPKKVVGFPQDFYTDSKILDDCNDFSEKKIKIEPKKRKIEMKEESMRVGKKVSKSDIENAFDW